MSAEQETKTTEESNIGGNLDAAGSAAGSASLGADASSKKSEEKRKPKKLGQKSNNNTPAKGDNEAETNGEADAPATPSKMDQSQQSRSKSRQASRSRGRGASQPPSDTDSAYRSDVSQKGSRRNRNRNRGKAQAQSQASSEQQGGGGGGGGPLDAVDEVGETVNGVADGAGDLVNDTAGKALSKPTEALGGLLGNKKKGGQQQGGGEEEEKDEGENEQLRLRLDLNLDIEVQLKAKIHGDLTLGLLCVHLHSTRASANVSQELVLDAEALYTLDNLNSTLRDHITKLLFASISSSHFHLCAETERLFQGVDIRLHCLWMARSVPSLCNKNIIIQILLLDCRVEILMLYVGAI